MRLANIQRSAVSRALGKVAAVVVIVIVAAAAGVGTIFATTATTTQTMTQTVNQTITQSATVTTTVTSLRTPTANNTIDLRANKTVFLAISVPPQHVGDLPYKFLIGGSINPTIVVKAGTLVRIVFYSYGGHSLIITSYAPEYPDVLTEAHLTPAFPGAGTHNPSEPFINNPLDLGLVFTVDKPGVYYYICGLSYHASGDMYGQFIVEE